MGRRLPGRALKRVALGFAAVLAVESALISAGIGAAFALEGTSWSADLTSQGRAEADTVASALLMARFQDRKIEVLSERTTSATTYALPSGELQTSTYAAPIRQQVDGRWRAIDTSLSDTGAALEPEVAAADIAVSDGGDTVLAGVTKGSSSFGLGWESKLPTPKIEDDTAAYDLGGGQTLTVTALSQGFSQNVVLHRRPTRRWSTASRCR